MKAAVYSREWPAEPDEDDDAPLHTDSHRLCRLVAAACCAYGVLCGVAYLLTVASRVSSLDMSNAQRPFALAQ